MRRALRCAGLLLAAALISACQSPTEPDEVPTEITASPDPTTATGPTGVTYVVQRDNRPDEIREYDWRTFFTVTIRAVNLDAAADITSLSVNVQQASGGIVVPPTTGETEKYQFNSSPSGNRLERNGTVTIGFEVLYDLPNLGKEALVTVTLGFLDDDDVSFTDSVKVRVAP
jgi:hypothetical protein